jgi:hypothetical protein
MESIIKKSLVVLLITAIFACDVDSNCESVNVNYITFRTVTLDANLNENPKEVKFDSVISPQTDSIFVYQDTISNFRLPLSPVENQTDFFFYYEGKGDTIRFTYEKISRVDSPECGIDLEYVGLDTAFQTFDSLIFVNDTLKRTVNAPNIKLFVF